MRVSILGAGAIGASLAALLARKGVDVTLVARGEMLKSLLDRPLKVTGAAGAFEAPLAVAERAHADADVHVVAVKTQDLATALRAIPAGDALVVTMQNGVRAEEIASPIVGASRVVGCVTSYDAEYREPGAVSVGRIGGLTLGRPKGPVDDAVLRVRDVLREAMPATATDNLAGARWTKLLVNLNNALPAATGLSIQEAYGDARVPRFAARLLKEGASVARAEGIALAPIPWANPRLVRLLSALPEGVAAPVLKRRVLSVLGAPPAFASTWQSLSRGKTTEIDWLNGEIVRLGRARRMSVAANAAVVRAVKKVEQDGRFWSVERLLAEVRPED